MEKYHIGDSVRIIKGDETGRIAKIEDICFVEKVVLLLFRDGLSGWYYPQEFEVIN